MASRHSPKAMKCRLCQHKPCDFEGHAALGPMVDARPAEGTAFACMLCGCQWIRRHSGNGQFEWLPWSRMRSA